MGKYCLMPSNNLYRLPIYHDENNVMLINLHIFMPPPFNELTTSSANHLNFIHKVWDHKRQTKFDLELYHFVRSRITPFDLPKKEKKKNSLVSAQ